MDQPACVGLDVAVAAGVLLDVEPGQVETLGQLHRVCGVPPENISDVKIFLKRKYFIRVSLVGDVVSRVAVAGDLEGAGLTVHGVELQVHGTGEGQGDPDAVQDVAVGKDAHVQVGLEDLVETADLLVAEKRVGHPYSPRIRHGQILDAACHRQK